MRKLSHIMKMKIWIAIMMAMMNNMDMENQKVQMNKMNSILNDI